MMRFLGVVFCAAVLSSMLSADSERPVPNTVEIYYVPDSILTRSPIDERYITTNFSTKYVLNTSWETKIVGLSDISRFRKIVRDIRLLVVLDYGDHLDKYYSDLTLADDGLRKWCRDFLKDRTL